MLNTIPSKINFDKEFLYIEWKDGKECKYNLLQLRRYCPCAQCRGGHEINSVRTSLNIDKIELVNWKKVGRYAISLVWSDGHSTGIYTFDDLRRACDENRDYGIEY